MKNCEICGAKENNLTEVKISGANMMVCSSCSDMGTKLNKEDEKSKKQTKYSTNKEDEKDDNNKGQNSSKVNKNDYNSQDSDHKTKNNSFDDLSELALDYGEIIREERNNMELNRNELAQSLGIKESHLENIENERTQPSVDIQKKIEKELDIDLTIDEDF
jgi:putative transcription factor